MDAIKVKLIGLSRGGGGDLQPDKTVTPTEQEQTVRADPGYDGLRQVTVEAIPDQYADVSGVDAGAGDVRIGKVIVGSEGEAITGTMPPQKPEEIGHATPTEQAQTVTPTAGSVFSAVEVDAIPTEYADVSSVDATAADVRTGKVIVDASGEEITGVMEPQKPEQVKNATPTTSPQSVTPDTGYALSRVDVGAIPSEYADVSDVTATAGTVLTGSDFVDASGTLVHGACDFDADTSDADATAGQIEAGATAYVGGTKVTGTMPIRTTDVEISDLSPVAIPAGSYDGTVSARLSAAAAAEVDGQYIAQGHSILGEQGTLVAQDNLIALIDDTLTDVSYSTVSDIPQYSFYGKTALISANFPAVETIGKYAFSRCSNLSNIFAQNTVYIGEGAFNSSGIETANFPNASMPTSAPNLFMNCRSLRQVILSNLNQTTWDMFRGCISLVDVQIPKVTIVEASNTNGGGSFAQCTALKYIELPSCAELRGRQYSGAFLGCSNLEVIDIGASCAIQGGRTLQNCTKLASIIMRGDSVGSLGGVDAMNGTPFAANGTGGTLFIPQSLYDHLGDGTADDYLNATNWSVILSYPNNQILPIEGSPYEVTT